MSGIKKMLILTSITFLFLPVALSVSADVANNKYKYNIDTPQGITKNKTTEVPKRLDTSDFHEAMPSEVSQEQLSESDPGVQSSIQPKNPRLGISSGFITSFKDLSTPDTSKIHIQTASDTTVQIGVDVQYETRISIDPEIAVLFDAVQNSGKDLKQYLSGTLTTVSTVGIGAVSHNIQDAWDRSPNWLQPAKYTAHYDSAAKSIIVRGNKLLFTLSNGWLNTDITIDLNKMKLDTGILVERKAVYRFKTITATTGYNWAILGDESKLGAIYPDFENNWIENKVEPTSLETNDQINLFGQTTQDIVNEHPTDYSIELVKNGITLADNIAIDSEGKWSYKMSASSPQGTKITARVVGKERASHENGIVDTKYSTPTSIFLGGGGEIPFDKWQVKSPIIAQAYSGETAVKGYAPSQNLDEGRSYTLFVRFNNATEGAKIILEKTYAEPLEYIGNIFGKNLKAGDNFEAWIVGKDREARTKESSHVFMTVLDAEETWNISPPHIDEIYEGDDSYYISTPSQSSNFGRTYDLQIWINGTLSQAIHNISAYGGEGYYSAQALKVGDKVTAQIIGHESGKSDQLSTTAMQIVKSSNTAPDITLTLGSSDKTTQKKYGLKGVKVMDQDSDRIIVYYSLDGGTHQMVQEVDNKSKGQYISVPDILLKNLSLGTHKILIYAKDNEGLVSNPKPFTLNVLAPVPGGAVTINYIDAADKHKIGPKQKVLNGNIGDNFSQKSPVIPGYENPDHLKIIGTYSDKTQNFTIEYTHKQGAPVTIKYQDDEGMKISSDNQLKGLWGETKLVTPKNIPGYQFVKQSGLSEDFKVKFDDTEKSITFIYRKGTLDIVSAPKLDFGVQKISSSKKIYIPSTNEDLTVRDNRATGGWTLSVRTSRPLAALSNPHKKLSNNLFYKTPDQKELIVSDVSNVIYSSAKHSNGETILSKNWGTEEGFHLDILPGQVIADSYSGILEWTLSDIPQ